MKASVHQFVQECEICQRAKPDRAKYPGLLSPLPVPKHFWQIISMDFIEGLPRSGRYNCIYVVVDKLSHYAHFMRLAHPYTAVMVAQVFMDNIYKLHGLPEEIISDHDKIFNSSFWQELFRIHQTDLKMSSSYHLETDGTTERVNRCLETYLRCFTHACPTKWMQWLALAEFWYNSSYHSALDKSPFEPYMATLLVTLASLQTVLVLILMWRPGCRTDRLWLICSGSTWSVVACA